MTADEKDLTAAESAQPEPAAAEPVADTAEPIPREKVKKPYMSNQYMVLPVKSCVNRAA